MSQRSDKNHAFMLKGKAATIDVAQRSEKSASLSVRKRGPTLLSPDRRPMTVDNDVVMKRTGLSIGVVAGTQREKVFGVDYYKNPKADHKYRILGSAGVRKKRLAFTEIESNFKKWVPSPNQFKQTNWKYGAHMPISNLDTHTLQSGEVRKGVFSNRPRTTFTEEVMKAEKIKPAPSLYQWNNLDKKT